MKVPSNSKKLTTCSKVLTDQDKQREFFAKDNQNHPVIFQSQRDLLSMNLNAPARSDKRIYNTSPNTSIIPKTPPDNRRLDLQLDLLSSEYSRDRGIGREKPPIIFADNELPGTIPFLIEPDKRNRFKLYANDASRQEYAGLYYDFEVAYFLKHWPRPPVPSVAAFMSVAEQIISRGYVPPSQMSAEQIQALRGVA